MEEDAIIITTSRLTSFCQISRAREPFCRFATLGGSVLECPGLCA